MNLVRQTLCCNQGHRKYNWITAYKILPRNEVVKGIINILPQISSLLKPYSQINTSEEGESIIYFHKVNAGEANLCFY
jgi:hypothetical protein